VHHVAAAIVGIALPFHEAGVFELVEEADELSFVVQAV
jgi:hypothetical protein